LFTGELSTGQLFETYRDRAEGVAWAVGLPRHSTFRYPDLPVL